MKNKNTVNDIQCVPIFGEVEKISNVAPKSLLKLSSGIAHIFKILSEGGKVNDIGLVSGQTYHSGCLFVCMVSKMHV